MKDLYEAVIGLEIHAQISTKTKMFCRCDNDSFSHEPNINTCEICMGFPGTLPLINKEAVQKGLITGLALHATLPNFSKFDRKNYFYPDLPKGFQISQYDEPICVKGYVEIEINDEIKKIGIERLHLEDDAGKLTHVNSGTLCDFNRSGTPLMEIVSAPEIRNEKEAVQYAKEIQKILRYLGSSDADMEKGMMRFDINVSVRKKGIQTFGTKVEVKNLNSFKALEKAIIYEINRQIKTIEKGKKIIQETRGWDDVHGVTLSQRTKEEAQDYRYFPEPDLPPLSIDGKMIEEMRKSLPELPLEKRLRFEKEWKISKEDARILTEDLLRARFFEETVNSYNDPKKAAAFINTILLGHLNKDNKAIKDTKITPQHLGKLIQYINEGKISYNLAKGEIFDEMYESGQDPELIIQKKGMSQKFDEKKLKSLCETILKENPQIVEQYKNGKKSVMGFFIGQVMQKTLGAANPKEVQMVIEELIEEQKS